VLEKWQYHVEGSTKRDSGKYKCSIRSTHGDDGKYNVHIPHKSTKTLWHYLEGSTKVWEKEVHEGSRKNNI
jgi:hypothetical protein